MRGELRVEMEKELLFKNEVYAIIGAAMDVYNELGSGFAEPVYQEAMQLEFVARGIPFEPQKRLNINYKGAILDKKYFADFLCFGEIIVELKAQREMAGYEQAQVLNYLKATGLRLAVIINFGDPDMLDWHRYVA
jgi:GxxExxY protein